MEFNILKKGINNFQEKTEYEFWYIYCQLLNLRNPVLTDKDCVLLAKILSLDIDEKSIMEKSDSLRDVITKTNLYSKCKQLAEKDVFIESEKNYYLNPNLAAFQKYIKSTKDKQVKFVLPIEICQ